MLHLHCSFAMDSLCLRSASATNLPQTYLKLTPLYRGRAASEGRHRRRMDSSKPNPHTYGVPRHAIHTNENQACKMAQHLFACLATQYHPMGKCGALRHIHRPKLMRKRLQAAWRDARVRNRVHRRNLCRRHHRQSLLDHHRQSRDAYTACSGACSGGLPDCRRG